MAISTLFHAVEAVRRSMYTYAEVTGKAATSAHRA
jgi:hypothetical protein